MRWTYDTVASISAFSLDAKIGTETEANECSYKNYFLGTSGFGGLSVPGTTEYGSDVPREESRCSQNSNQREAKFTVRAMLQ